jgi:putative molybdopterin biosynthesis protein
MNAIPENPLPGRTVDGQLPRFMSVKQVAEYLHLNDKKVYALVREHKIPATKITGKWVFPRELIDRWLLESSHGGLLTDRLIVVGGDDPLLYHLVLNLASSVGERALVSYSPTGTRLGLGLLATMRADVGCLHWGPQAESAIRHPALLQQYSAHKNWVLVRAFRREQGLIVAPGKFSDQADVSSLLRAKLRWALRQPGSGTHRFFQEALALNHISEDHLDVTSTALSEREAAALVAMGKADVVPGVRASANEFGLAFVGIGWEAFDFALGRGVYFRRLFQSLIEALNSRESGDYAARLGGYDLSVAGELVWGMS